MTVSEMVSANALAHNPKRSRKLYEKSPLETPYSVQLAASNAAVLAEAVRILNDEEWIDIIDLNAGCPAPKVVRGGGGSALLKSPALLGTLIETIKKTSSKRQTSVKIRLGFSENNGVELAKVCESAGADFVAVHGRTRAGGFESPVDYNAIGEIKTALKIPVIANGDIDSYELAQTVFAATNADGVMIGRGAMGSPWIFEQLTRNIAAPTNELKRAVVLEHFDAMRAFHGDFAVPLFRKHLHRYSKGLAGATQFRNRINHEESAAVIRELISLVFEGGRDEEAA
ncbi:tRNA-dihydrouridine synthase [Campylobacterota bacterium]|nr:tRNA-dihydrouridine synthase [Campylobacterota bacterium]